MSKVELVYNINTKNDFGRLDVEALGDTFEVSRKTFSLEEEDKMINQKTLKEYFTYDKDTGLFTRLKSKDGRPFKADGHKSLRKGYVRLKILGKQYGGHVMAWLYQYGDLPNCDLDHINHDRSDNRIVNLRKSSKTINSQNQSRSSNNTSGVVGVSFQKGSQLWRATIRVDGKLVQLISSRDKEVCVLARKEAEIKYGFHENHGKEKL